jgi:hypothetical protein
MTETEPLKHSQPEAGGSPRAPWSPTGIALLTLFCSPLAGGILHGLNYGRLGQPVYRRFALARNLLAAMLMLFPTLFLKESYSLGASLFFAVFYYKTQEEAFQRHLSQGGKKGSIFMAILLSLAVLIMVAVLTVLAS